MSPVLPAADDQRLHREVWGDRLRKLPLPATPAETLDRLALASKK